MGFNLTDQINLDLVKISRVITKPEIENITAGVNVFTPDPGKGFIPISAAIYNSKITTNYVGTTEIRLRNNSNIGNTIFSAGGGFNCFLINSIIIMCPIDLSISQPGGSLIITNPLVLTGNVNPAPGAGESLFVMFGTYLDI